MHGRIECQQCGDIKDGCRCPQHDHIVLYELCGRCKERPSSRSEESPFQIKKIEQRIVGETLISEVWLELKTPIKFVVPELKIIKKD